MVSGMRRETPRALYAAVSLAAILLVASAVQADDDQDVKSAFQAFQGALKLADCDKLWSLLDTKALEEADTYAKTVQAAYGKSNDDERAKLEKALGLSADEMSKLTGKLYVKSKPFRNKYREVPGSKIDKVSVEGDRATVNYTEEDNDKEKLELVRQDGKWKLSIPVK
jgi:hypothetical protein